MQTNSRYVEYIVVLAKIVLYAGLLSSAVQAELTPWGSNIPRRSHPPIVFVTGHDSICPDPRSGELPFFKLTFGAFDTVVNQSGRIAMVFEMCYASNRPGLEVVAERFSQLTRGLQFEDGQPVPEIDVVAHNIGGLMIRSYLAQRLAGPRIRKVVFIGAPHFGTSVAAFTDPDPQLREISFGNRWLFELATWNQGRDDLRGADAISLVGTAGINTQYGVTDSVVTVNSAALDFITPGRTVTLPLCHTQGGIGQLFLCRGALGLANVRDANHPTARITLAFLNGGDWQNVTRALGGPSTQSQTAALVVQKRTADNRPVPIESATLILPDGRSLPLSRSTEGLAFITNAPAGRSRLVVNTEEILLHLQPGASQAVTVKPGPFIAGVEPFPAASWPMVLAPGMLVRIRGRQLTDGFRQADVRLGGQPTRVLTTTQDGELVAVLPDIAPGLTDLTLRNSFGEHAVRVVLDAAVPAFLRTQANTPAVVQLDANTLTLYLTGLGRVRTQDSFLVHVATPEVTLAGRPCAILFSGRSTLPGVDQVNCRLTDPVTPGPVDVVLRTAGHTASASLLLQ